MAIKKDILSYAKGIREHLRLLEEALRNDDWRAIAEIGNEISCQGTAIWEMTKGVQS